MKRGTRTILTIAALAIGLNLLVSALDALRSEVLINRPVARFPVSVNHGNYAPFEPDEVSLLGAAVANSQKVSVFAPSSTFQTEAPVAAVPAPTLVSAGMMMPSRTVIAGWPLKSFKAYAEWYGAAPGTLRCDGGVVFRNSLQYHAAGTTLSFIVLPYVPIWQGVITNTSIFAAIVYAVFFARRHIVRARRRFRSLCTKCGYPIAGQRRCPECGQACTVADSARE